VLYDLGQSVEAIAELSRAVEGRGVFPRAHYELGRALVRAGRLLDAMSHLKTAVEQQGGVFAEAHFQIGLLLSRQGDVESALDAYQIAVKQSGGIYPEAYYHMGLDHVRVRNTEAAVRAYRKAIEQRGDQVFEEEGVVDRDASPRPA
jgi:tetratricopeptide (TPR) repeat protein